MEKLLHERLREWEDNGDGTYSVLIENADVRTTKSALMALADEIERYYIPLPRDDNGELWNVDDPCIAKGEEGTVAGFDGEEFINVRSNSSHVHFWCDKRYVKRPTPKIYDADGVEIKVGDTVYELKNGKKLRIKEADAHHILCAHVDGYGSYECFDADKLTHERPVFDAEGERIRKGDMVWHTMTGDKHIVEELTEDGVIYIDRSSLTWSGDIFTHREPDSMERIIKDIIANGGGSCREYWEQRLTALIERGA